MLSVLLESLNMKADYAESARRAAQKLAQAYREGNPYTLMMVDYCMPETDGLLLTAHLRQNAKFANLNIIAVSAVNDPEIMQSFMAHGVIDYLVKPVRLNSLKASLSKVPNMQLLSAA
jgi:two-component system sensor histidine kinase/response regulator